MDTQEGVRCLKLQVMIRSNDQASLVIDRTTLFWGLLTLLTLAVLFSSYLLG